MSSNVSVVVVAWNSGGIIRDCLVSAFAENPSEVIVVDNGSRDDTVAQVRNEFSSARLIALAENRGFAAGSNAGLAATSSPYVLFLNDDAVLRPGYLTMLVQALER